MSTSFPRRILLVAVFGAGLGTQRACAQFATGLENPQYVASSAGLTLTGQDGWVASGVSFSFSVYQYTGNAPTIAPNPAGGSQFVAATLTSTSSTSPVSLHNVSFAPGGSWTATWDVAVNSVGATATNLGIGGIQTFGGGNRSIILRNSWTDQTHTTWNAMVNPYDANGNAIGSVVPDPAFGNLAPNHWFRQSATWSFDTNLITSLSITDLMTGITTTVHPAGFYILGGASSTADLPTQVRLSAGGAGTAGSFIAFDNFNIAPTPACPADFNQSGSLSTQDIFDFLNAWFAGSAAADFNGANGLTEQDIFDFLNAWFAGCA